MMNQITKSMIDPSSIGMKSYAWSLDLFSFFVFQNRDKNVHLVTKKLSSSLTFPFKKKWRQCIITMKKKLQ